MLSSFILDEAAVPLKTERLERFALGLVHRSAHDVHAHDCGGGLERLGERREVLVGVDEESLQGEGFNSRALERRELVGADVQDLEGRATCGRYC